MAPALIQTFVNLTPLILFITCLNTNKMFLRISSFLFVYISVSFHSSQGSNAYTELLPLIWISFFAIFCKYKPNAALKYRYKELLKMNLVIGSLLLPYILAGLWKLFYGGIYQLFWDKISVWNPEAFLFTMNTYLSRIDSTSWLQNFFNQFPIFSWFALGIVTLWEVSLLAIFWKPKHWKALCIQINLFHLAVIWTLDILFYPQIGLFLLLYFINPLDGDVKAQTN
jgi:hypothetical protein